MRWLALPLLFHSTQLAAQRPLLFHSGFGVAGETYYFESTSGFGMIEAGARLHVGSANFGIAFIGRHQSMNRSDIESGILIYGYDSDFQGVLFSAGFSS